MSLIQKIDDCKMTKFPLPSIPDNSAKGLTLEIEKRKVKVILVRKNGILYGYQNRCPHTGVNLEWMPDQFLDSTESLLQCATHGALFNIEDGYCVAGPCSGQSLQSLQISEEGSHFRVAL